MAHKEIVHAMLADYLSFIVLLFALYVVAGGILVTGNLRGTPLTNTALLGVGTLVASLVGTTGAAMILIRPLLRANQERRHRAHIVVFFIILVANVGGALTPLADGGYIWLLTPKAGREGHVEPSDIGEAAPTAGLSQTSSVSAARDWSGTRLVAPKARR